MIYTIAVILHFLFDWILQPREIAKTKSKNLKSLLKHLFHGIGSISNGIFLIFFCLTWFCNVPVTEWFLFGWLNLFFHGLIDWYLPKLFKPGLSERRMVNMVAVDQMLHLSILFLSINYLI